MCACPLSKLLAEKIKRIQCYLYCNLETIEKKEFSEALHDLLNVMKVVHYLPRRFLINYLYFHFSYQRTRKIVQKYLNQIIEQEVNETPQSRLERKRTSLIASLVRRVKIHVFKTKSKSNYEEEIRDKIFPLNV